MNLELLSTVKVIFYFYFFDMHIVWKLPKSCARLTTHDLEEKTFLIRSEIYSQDVCDIVYQI